MTAVADRVTRVDICSLDQLTPELGVAALVGGEQVAVFRLADDRVFAVSNHCPFSGAAVIARGITGSRGDVPTIASPVYKQVFSLEDGRCLDAVDTMPVPGRGPDLAVYAVSVDDGRVTIDLPAAA
jgi:nitrite reductase (NADH) small subunit